MCKLRLIARNKDNSKFRISFLGIKFNLSEKNIVKLINYGLQFYVKDTEVIVLNGHIKTKANKTKNDNIGMLPLYKFYFNF